jgi:hypothetical protein
MCLMGRTLSYGGRVNKQPVPIKEQSIMAKVPDEVIEEVEQGLDEESNKWLKKAEEEVPKEKTDT